MYFERRFVPAVTMGRVTRPTLSDWLTMFAPAGRLNLKLYFAFWYRELFPCCVGGGVEVGVADDGAVVLVGVAEGALVVPVGVGVAEGAAVAPVGVGEIVPEIGVGGVVAPGR